MSSTTNQQNNNERPGLPNGPPQIPPQRLYVGKWTREEEEYVDGLIENFRSGNIPDIPDGTTLRYWLAGKLSCRVKRISKRYENTGYNGRAQYKDKEAGFSPEVYAKMTAKLEEQRLAFLASREQVMQGLAYARGSRRASRTVPTGRGRPGHPLPSGVGAGGASLPGVPVLNLESVLAASALLTSSSLVPPSLPTLGVPGLGVPQQVLPSSTSPASLLALGLGGPIPPIVGSSFLPQPPATTDSSTDLLLRAALIQKLSGSARPPTTAGGTPNPTSGIAQALIASQQQQQQQQEQSTPGTSSTTMSSLVEALKIKQQIQQHQDRTAVLERAMQEHLIAAALGNDTVSES